MTFPALDTTRLQLIEVMPEHAPAIFHIFSNEDVTRFYGMDPLRETSDALNIIDSFKQTYDSGQGIRWGMVIRETGTFIGTLGLNHLSLYSKKAEIGFELDPAHWRCGYAAEAIQAVLEYAFETLALHRLGAVTFLENQASINLLKRFGFEEEGVLRGYLFQGGTSHDGRIFSLLRLDHQAIVQQHEEEKMV
ncbi:GNAT family N-acetyltransferase [Exiguobacterium antarcticum]|uniref:GNAT family N-acetyltransferase n=1 Tax=Exiguobacterium antarcticum TaxID=132920 RepID=UPI000285ED51|nr:GNAT family N-acetyltransferase [Exiguobacterium antarcticum]AFS70457.1 Acetyltransferase, GNAT family domain protein [Exiguobacterium antarcticum B7]